MIDLSDGLSIDLRHICEESNVGAKIWANAIPRAELGSPPRGVDLELALHGGEDYELLFTISPNKPVPKRIARVPITCIGEITRNKRMTLIHENGSRSILKPQGWEHFRF